MKEKLSYDSEGNYHDDDVRLNNYTESADIPRLERTDVAQANFNAHVKQDVDPILVDRVVSLIQRELGSQMRLNPITTTEEIKTHAKARFIDLIEKKLLTPKEADRCYQRFVQMVHYYYGSY